MVKTNLSEIKVQELIADNGNFSLTISHFKVTRKMKSSIVKAKLPRT